MATKVLVTAGGTKVRIDDVRYVGNFSKGRFGLEIANAFSRSGADVYLLGSEDLVEREHPGTADPQTYECFPMLVTPFKYYEDFRDSLFRIVAEEKPDIVVMTAAVSDWLCADAREGKIDSSANELVLRFMPAPKIIAELRERCGKTTFIVGFKLLAGAPRSELMEKAHKQVRENRLNLTVANDLTEIGEQRHPVTLVTPEGGEIALTGSKRETAWQIRDFILRRQRVRWTKSVSGGSSSADGPGQHPNFGKIAGLNEFAKSARLFSGTDGNMSWRAPEQDSLMVSPRQRRKADLLADDFVFVRRGEGSEQIYYGRHKPSIDSSVQAELYARLPAVFGLLHVHGDAGIVIPDAVTTFPYPCGALEEADEIIRVLADDKKAGGRFAVELVHHGFLIGLEETGVERLRSEWSNVRAAYHGHLREIGHQEMSATLELRPIFVSARIAGVLAWHPGEHWASSFLLPTYRGQGLGPRILEAMARRGLTVKAHDFCAVREYYLSHGWTIASRDGLTVLLAPPSKIKT